jgi:ATP-dependent Lon protease
LNKISDVVLKPSEVNSVIENVPEKLPILPLRDIVIFPYMIFPVLVGREQSIRAANYAAETTKYIFLSTQKKSNHGKYSLNIFIRLLSFAFNGNGAAELQS